MILILYTYQTGNWIIKTITLSYSYSFKHLTTYFTTKVVKLISTYLKNTQLF